MNLNNMDMLTAYLTLAVWIGLPLAVLLDAIFLRPRNRWSIILRLTFVLVFLPWGFWSFQWSFVWYPLRWAMVVAMAIAVVVLSLKFREAGWRGGSWRWYVGAGFSLLVIVLLGLLSAMVIRGVMRPEVCVAVASPLRNGRYVVFHGGSTPPVNVHAIVNHQAYALDIGKLVGGRRGTGVFLTSNEQSFIWGDTVFAICSGVVLEAMDGLQDATPSLSHMDTIQPAGNYVKQLCQVGNDTIVVLYAHLQRGSLRVSEGSMLMEGTSVALVGNSGNTSEPHLHIQANTPSGEPVPLCIAGKWLVRNSVFSVR